MKAKQRGATLVEYVAGILVIAVICIAGVAAFGEAVAGSYCRSGGKVISANNPEITERNYYYNKSEKKCCYDTGGWGGGTVCP